MLKLLEGQMPQIDANTKLPPELAELDSKINNATRRILALKQDFDEENSPSYKRITILRAITFLKKLAYAILRK